MLMRTDPFRELDRLTQQFFGDVRDIPAKLFEGVDAVVHLAAVSNDPMGTKFEAPTDAINFRASVQIADVARAAGVKNFVFASNAAGGLFLEKDDELQRYGFIFDYLRANALRPDESVSMIVKLAKES